MREPGAALRSSATRGEFDDFYTFSIISIKIYLSEGFRAVVKGTRLVEPITKN